MAARRKVRQSVVVDANGDMASAAEMTGKRYDLVVQTLVEAFADRLKAVVRFGSQARGEAGPGSDHDLLVVIENLPASRLARQRSVRGTLLPILDRLPGSISICRQNPPGGGR